jgi:glycosyl transferase family WbsX
MSSTVGSASGSRPEVLAFYLPQFHQVPENDAWHGSGFTEWTVVAKSRPLFLGHRQPEYPGELGYYDLRVPETRNAQARLAREHGITGFLYYHYWFGGKRMLGRPFDEVLASGQPEFPFALCWANESWFRRWQGVKDEMLVEQTFSEEDDLAHIRWLIECFKDPRYIRVEGRPLLAVYRTKLLPDAQRTVELWRRECAAAGVEPPWLVTFETNDADLDPTSLGFDASAEFVPHQLTTLLDPARITHRNENSLFEYDDVQKAYLGRPEVPWLRYPCVATGWDNSPRRQHGDAFVLQNSTPESYGSWLREALKRQSRTEHGIVFVNAWNEWAEGAHLEPDTHWGRAYLEATRSACVELFGGSETSQAPGADLDDQARPIGELYQDLYEEMVQLQRWSSGLISYWERRVQDAQHNTAVQMAAAGEEIGRLARLNQEMAELLVFRAERLRELGDEVTESDWLVIK